MTEMMETMMKAVVYHRYGAPDVLEMAEIPKPAIKPDQLLVRVAAAGINPADSVLRRGDLKVVVRLKFPFVPGMDVAGVVVEVGAQVTRFRPGDAVYAMQPTISGGSYAEYAAIKEADATFIPANITFAEASAVPLVALTALQSLRDQADLKPGMKLLVHGASGGVGTFGVQIGKIMGANVTATTSARNVDFVRTLGADSVIDYTAGDITKRDEQYDVIFDAVGLVPFWAWRRITRPHGVIVTVNPVLGGTPMQMAAKLMGSQRLKSVFVQPNGNDLATISEWIAHERLHVVVERSFPLAKAVEAHRAIETKRTRGKLVLTVDEALATQRAGEQVGAVG